MGRSLHPGARPFRPRCGGSWSTGRRVPVALSSECRIVTGASPRATQPSWSLRLAVAVLLCGVFLATEVVARNGNPWAAPGPGEAAPTLRPQADGRFAPREYDPVNDRQRRESFRFGESIWPDASGRMPDAYSGPGAAPGQPGWGLYDPATSALPWSSLYGVPGATGYPGLYPYGTYPGSGMLWPGTGVTAPGLGLPLYGVPLLGTPY